MATIETRAPRELIEDDELDDASFGLGEGLFVLGRGWTRLRRVVPRDQHRARRLVKQRGGGAAEDESAEWTPAV